MIFKIIVVFIFSILLGIGLGCIPGLNQHLHWNIWFVVPISGLFFGSIIGTIQFWSCFFLSQKIKGASLIIFIIAGAIAYFYVDYGIFLSSEVSITDVNEMQDGIYDLSQLTTFQEFIKARLESSTILFHGEYPIFDMGGAGTKLSYLFDFIGVFVGAFVSLFFFSRKYPYCNDCSIYKRREKKYVLYLSSKGETLDNILTKIAGLAENSPFNDLSEYINELVSQYSTKKGDIKLSIDQRFCPSCQEASVVGKVFKKDAYEWESVNKLSFSFDFNQG